MKTIKEKMALWWDGLAAREKQTVVIGGMVTSILLFYALIWSPALDHVAQMRKQLTAQQKLLLWMQQAQKELKQNQNSNASNSQAMTPVALLSYLQKQLEQAGLMQSTTQLKQIDADRVSLHFQNVSFDALLRVLISALHAQRVTITQLSAVAQTTPGIVNADVIIRIK